MKSLAVPLLSSIQSYLKTRSGTTPKTINHNPLVNAGSDHVTSEGTNDVTLKGKGKDPDRDSLTYSWEQTGGPRVDLNRANTASSTFSTPNVDGDKVLTFVLTVYDGRGGQGTDDVKITVKDRPKIILDGPVTQEQSQKQLTVNQTSNSREREQNE